MRTDRRSTCLGALLAALLLLALSANAVANGKPTVGEARRFMAEVEETLLQLWTTRGGTCGRATRAWRRR